MQLIYDKINHQQIMNIKERYPPFELSYESDLHNKVHEKYDVVLAIPMGKKYIVWFTFYQDFDAMLLLELNKEKRICNVSVYKCNCRKECFFNTVFYGTVLEEDPDGGDHKTFIIEDIHYWNGIHISTRIMQNRFYFIHEFLGHFNEHNSPNHGFTFAMPHFWNVGEEMPAEEYHYNVHHLQYRSLYHICPFLNQPIKEPLGNAKKDVDMPIYFPYRADVKKPQYKMKTVFAVKADLQADVYRLFAFGKFGKMVYYNTAYISSYKTSVFMNGLFRTVKENIHLDYIEESDDEDDFQNVDFDKYVDLQKTILMECTFHHKFKRWMPLRVVQDKKVVHIHQL